MIKLDLNGREISVDVAADSSPQPTDAQIDAAMAGNICRCGTYQRIRAAIHRAATSNTGA
jgi:isoquinoline 1-oxidoreductase alpha subunit